MKFYVGLFVDEYVEKLFVFIEMANQYANLLAFAHKRSSNIQFIHFSECKKA